MKKLISIILAVAMTLCCFALVGCGKTENKTDSKVAMTTATSPTSPLTRQRGKLARLSAKKTTFPFSTSNLPATQQQTVSL